MLENFNTKYHPLMMIRRVVLLIISLLVASQWIYLSHAANLSLVARYDNSGWLKWNLNSVWSLINGRDVCPSANTNSNNVPWCDMSSDVAYDDNDTPSIGADDSYGSSADIIIRTNDAFSYTIWWAWTDVAWDGEEVVTIEATLPESPVTWVQIYEWDDLPGYCDFDTSSISEDKRTLTCVRVDFDLNDVWSYSEDVSLPVRVLWWAPNGTQMWELTTTISSLNATSVTDTTKWVGFTVTASPRWDMNNGYWKESGYTTRSGVTWRYLYYRYYIWLDEVTWEEDTGVSALWNESLGSDTTVNFTHELNAAMKDVEFVSCNPKHHYSNGQPYPFLQCI